MCKQHKFEGSVKWYKHIPKNVENNENFKILWDLTITELTRNWISIALKSPLWTNIASSLMLHSLVTQEEKAKKGLDLAVEINELCKMMV